MFLCDIEPVAIIIFVFGVASYFLLGAFGNGLGGGVVTVGVQEVGEACLQGCVVVLHPAILGQHEVGEYAVAGFFQCLDFAGCGVYLRIGLRPEVLDGAGSLQGSPRDFGDGEYAAGLQKGFLEGDAAAEADVVDGTFGPQEVELFCGKRQIVHGGAQWRDVGREMSVRDGFLKPVEKGGEEVNGNDFAGQLLCQCQSLCTGAAADVGHFEAAALIDAGKGERQPGGGVASGALTVVATVQLAQ